MAAALTRMAGVGAGLQQDLGPESGAQSISSGEERAAWETQGVRGAAGGFPSRVPTPSSISCLNPTRPVYPAPDLCHRR